MLKTSCFEQVRHNACNQQILEYISTPIKQKEKKNKEAKGKKARDRIGSSNCTSGYVPKIFETRMSKRYLYTRVHSSIIDFAIANVEATPKRPSVDERINKMWSTHTMEYYSA